MQVTDLAPMLAVEEGTTTVWLLELNLAMFC
jgi:hypothetical protein